MKYTGKVLWWSERDGNGIIKTESGDEYYTDISVTKESLERNQWVTFEHNESIRDCSCAHKIERI